MPNIPNKEKEKMSIYLLFVQHLIYALKNTGKGAIVVPTGFITAQSGIEKTIRQKLIENNWLHGVVSMPANIFANTGTQVSVVFIDKSPETKRPVFIDASKLGTQIKDGKNQRTVLSAAEEAQIVKAFLCHDNIEDFSIHPSEEEIVAKNYSFSAGQYFDIKIEHIPISQSEFKQKMSDYQQELSQLFAQSNALEKEIFANLEKVFLQE
ncbi:MAG: SAM-dependent DNA methyltransferase [Neisseriaceae bacterium]|nr:SAM-dependent DNA methyltransferase [Neisseriaceae bacterium]